MAPTFLHLAIFSLALAACATVTAAEKHTIRFQNNCGRGTPLLLQNGNTLSKGQDYTSNGPFSSAIAYLQTGECDFNGEKCATIEMTLGNADPSRPGSGSSTDIGLIAPHKLNVPVSFSYFGGCDGAGATCTTDDCSTAFFKPDDNQVQVACQENDVNLLITFCPSGSSDHQDTGKGAASSTSHAAPTTFKAAQTHAPSVPAVAATSPVVKVGAVPTPPPQADSAANASSTASAAANPSTSAPACRRRSRRARREISASPRDVRAESRAIYDAHRRHHARNAFRHS
ncbi:hypothetical protein K474DRAFT_1586553 [Panus rudis PR-1116 ss-1]|nr:hypothetical protein K474DRAFT_1586553 [Panus rudis PR-1116 ss-1]